LGKSYKITGTYIKENQHTEDGLLVPYLPIWNAYLKFNKPISPISIE